MSKWLRPAGYCLFLMLLIAPAAAQDATPTELPTATLIPTDPPTPPPTLTETATATYTETATSTATFTETPTASPTMAFTETATLEATASPSATVIETPTETATSATATVSPAPTATETAAPTAFPPEPPLTELFSDHFDTGALYLWTLGAGWGLVPSEGGQALQVSDSDAAVTFVHNTLTDVAVQARFLFDTGTARLSLRETGADSYNLRLNANGEVGLYRGDILLGSAIVSPNQAGTWRTLRLSAIGDIVRVAVDGVEVIALQDSIPLPNGKISYAGIETVGLKVDDFILSVPNSILISPTATASRTATATVESLSSFSSSASNTDLNLVFSQDFDGIESPFQDLVGFDHRIKLISNDVAMYITQQSVEPIYITVSVPADVVAEAQFLFAQGSAYLSVRQRENSGYRATLNSSGELTLYRNAEIVASQTLAANTPNQWRTVRLSVIGNTVTVIVDSVEVITFVDDNPLPLGYSAFGGDNLDQNGLLVDDIYLWAVIPATLNEGVSALLDVPTPTQNIYQSVFSDSDGILFTGSTQTQPQLEGLFVSSLGVTYPANRTGYTSASNADWSPVLQKRVFRCAVPGVSYAEICLGKLDGTETINLTNSATAAEDVPVFSPNGNWVAYTYAPDGGALQIRARNVTNPTQEVTILSQADLPTGYSFGSSANMDYGPDNYLYFSMFVGQGVPNRLHVTGIYRINLASIGVNPIPARQQVTYQDEDPLYAQYPSTFPHIGHENPDVVFNPTANRDQLLITRSYEVPVTFNVYNPILVYEYNPTTETYGWVHTAQTDLRTNQNFAIWSTNGARIAYETDIPNNQFAINVIYNLPEIEQPGEVGVPIDPPFRTGTNGARIIVWVPELILQITPTPVPGDATQTAAALLTQQAQATQTAQMQPTATQQPQECGPANEPWWKIQRFNENNRPRPTFPGIGSTRAHHGVNGSWMMKTFGIDSPYAALGLYDYDDAFTVLMPVDNHVGIGGRLAGATTWTWDQIEQRALEDFVNSETPENCEKRYWDEFKKEALRAVCGVLAEAVRNGIQVVDPALLRVLHVFDWLELPQQGFSDPCDAIVNVYARSLPR